jgi:hypothetical protein
MWTERHYFLIMQKSYMRANSSNVTAIILTIIELRAIPNAYQIWIYDTNLHLHAVVSVIRYKETILLLVHRVGDIILRVHVQFFNSVGERGGTARI